MAVQIQMRRGTAAAWTTANPTLAVGEFAIETDTDKYKIGDGATAWTSLTYSSLPSNVLPLTGGTLTGALTVPDLTVTGTTTTVSTTNTIISDSLIELNTGAVSNANDLGIVMERGSAGDNAVIVWDESADKFTMGTTTATGASTGDLTITTGTLVANLEGAVTGNADTVTALANARTIDGISFDGSANITTESDASTILAMQSFAG